MIATGKFSAMIVLAALLAMGCSPTGGPEGGGGSSFSDDVQPIFDGRCVICHEGGDLDLSAAHSYSNLVGVASSAYALDRVQPFDPDFSLLYHKVSGNEYGERMPLDSEPLPASAVESIRLWIEEGALAN